jgi:predicted ATPase
MTKEKVQNNLRPRLDSFVGREQEQHYVRDLLQRESVVSLVGAGGCGKTRLAVQCALQSLEAFPDGVWFIDLSVISDGALVPQTVQSVIVPNSGAVTVKLLIDRLTNKRVLLVLDNCEHVLDACVDLAQVLTGSAPNVRILATSRHPLGIDGEAAYRVPSLSVPPIHQDLAQEEIVKYEAPNLFLQRAAKHGPRRTLSLGEARSLVTICHSLGGIPLALELAAAQSAFLSLGEIEADLDEMFRLFVQRSEQVLPRQQTLRSLVDWSYKLLSPDEKRLFRWLSVFAGGWTVDAAQRLCRFAAYELAPFDADVPALLESLFEKSVVTITGGEAPYSMLPVIRHFAFERLRASGEERALLFAHCELCVDLSRGTTLPGRVDGRSGLSQDLQLGLEDFRSALSWAMANPDRTDAALRLSGELGVLWYQRGFGIEIRQWVHRALLRIERPKDPQARHLALFSAVAIAGFEGDYPTAKRYCDELEASARAHADDFFLATALNEQGKLAQHHQVEIQLARRYFQESLDLFRRLPNCDREANFVGLSLGHLDSSLGEYESAMALFRRSVESSRAAGDEETLAYGLVYLAVTLYDVCEYDEAAEVYRVARQSAQERGLRTLELNHWILSSRLEVDRGALEAGRAGYESALKLSILIADRHREQLARAGLARVLAEQGSVEEARQELKILWASPTLGEDDQLLVDILFSAAVLAFHESRIEVAANALGATQAARDTIAWVIPPAEKQRWDRLEVRLRAGLDDAIVGAAMQAGQGMSLHSVGLLFTDL